MKKEIRLVNKIDNGNGTTSMIAEICVYEDGVFSSHESRSTFTFDTIMTDEEIITSLKANEYSIYFPI